MLTITKRQVINTTTSTSITFGVSVSSVQPPVENIIHGSKMYIYSI